MKLVKSIKVCEYSRSRSFHDDFILQDQASGERSQDQWSSGSLNILNAYFLLSFKTSDLFLFYFSLKKLAVPHTK